MKIKSLVCMLLVGCLLVGCGSKTTSEVESVHIEEQKDIFAVVSDTSSSDIDIVEVEEAVDNNSEHVQSAVVDDITEWTEDCMSADAKAMMLEVKNAGLGFLYTLDLGLSEDEMIALQEYIENEMGTSVTTDTNYIVIYGDLTVPNPNVLALQSYVIPTISKAESADGVILPNDDSTAIIKWDSVEDLCNQFGLTQHAYETFWSDTEGVNRDDIVTRPTFEQYSSSGIRTGFMTDIWQIVEDTLVLDARERYLNYFNIYTYDYDDYFVFIPNAQKGTYKDISIALTTKIGTLNYSVDNSDGITTTSASYDGFSRTDCYIDFTDVLAQCDDMLYLSDIFTDYDEFPGLVVRVDSVEDNKSKILAYFDEYYEYDWKDWMSRNNISVTDEEINFEGSDPIDNLDMSEEESMTFIFGFLTYYAVDLQNTYIKYFGENFMADKIEETGWFTSGDSYSIDDFTSELEGVFEDAIEDAFD